MSLPYFYASRPDDGVLTGAEAKHAHVKRINPGDRIMLVDGVGHTAFWPEVHAPVTTNQLAERLRGAHAIVLHEDATTPITDVEFPTDETLYVLVGPEGGIGQDELDLLGAQSVRLGPQVLRTASAGFAALCAIGALTSRW